MRTVNLIVFVIVSLTFECLQKNLAIARDVIPTIILDAIGFAFFAFYRHVCCCC